RGAGNQRPPPISSQPLSKTSGGFRGGGPPAAGLTGPCLKRGDRGSLGGGNPLDRPAVVFAGDRPGLPGPGRLGSLLRVPGPDEPHVRFPSDPFQRNGNGRET